MKTKIIISIALLFFFHNYAFAQYDYLRLTLEISRFKEKYGHIELNMYQQEGKYLMAVSSKSQSEKNGIKDSVYVIDKMKYDEISRLALSISSVDIMQKMNLGDLYHHNTTCIITIKGLGGDGITYSISAPYANTEKRGLPAYLQVCKEMLRAARLPVKKILD